MTFLRSYIILRDLVQLSTFNTFLRSYIIFTTLYTFTSFQHFYMFIPFLQHYVLFT